MATYYRRGSPRFDVLVVHTRDRSSGRYHVRYRIDNRLVVDERCNLDQSGAYDEVEPPADVEIGLLCKYCHPVPKA